MARLPEFNVEPLHLYLHRPDRLGRDANVGQQQQVLGADCVPEHEVLERLKDALLEALRAGTQVVSKRCT